MSSKTNFDNERNRGKLISRKRSIGSLDEPVVDQLHLAVVPVLRQRGRVHTQSWALLSPRITGWRRFHRQWFGAVARTKPAWTWCTRVLRGCSFAAWRDFSAERFQHYYLRRKLSENKHQRAKYINLKRQNVAQITTTAGEALFPLYGCQFSSRETLSGSASAFGVDFLNTCFVFSWNVACKTISPQK